MSSKLNIRTALTQQRFSLNGEMAEWSKAPVLKTGKGL